MICPATFSVLIVTLAPHRIFSLLLRLSPSIYSFLSHLMYFQEGNRFWIKEKMHLLTIKVIMKACTLNTLALAHYDPRI